MSEPVKQVTAVITQELADLNKLAGDVADGIKAKPRPRHRTSLRRQAAAGSAFHGHATRAGQQRRRSVGG
jgi:hypothetical protein